MYYILTTSDIVTSNGRQDSVRNKNYSKNKITYFITCMYLQDWNNIGMRQDTSNRRNVDVITESDQLLILSR